MIDADDFRAASAALGDFDRLADPELEAAEVKIAAAVADNVRRAARRHRRSGRLERGLTVKTSGHGAQATATVHAGGPVAHLIAGGVAPHAIRATRSHALGIRRGGGTIVAFAEHVQHRGFRADPFFAEGVERSQAQIDQITADTADAIAGDLITDMKRRR